MKVNDYQFGRITIDGKVYTKDVIISPHAVQESWWRKEGHRLHIEDLGDIESASPDLLLVGTGFYGRMVVPDRTRQYLQAKGIEVHALRTSDAVQEFNELQKDFARIVAALHLTC
jgi:hypothetical protein